VKWRGHHACLESIALLEKGVRFEYDALCQIMSYELLRLLEKLGIVYTQVLWDPNYDNGMGREVYSVRVRRKYEKEN
jgi:hypothetical protein